MSSSAREFFRSCSRAGGVAVDVGAHIGIFTLEFCDLGFRYVHAFEPMPETFRRLKANIDANRLSEKVTLNRIAVADFEGKLKMMYDAYWSAASYVDSKGQLEVPCTTLDRYAVETGLDRIDLLKLDTEGYETHVLRGAAALLRDGQVRNIYFEYAPRLLIRSGSSPDSLWKLFRESGYDVYRLRDSSGMPERIADPTELEGVEFENLVASPCQ